MIAADAVAGFADAMRKAGVEPPAIVKPDGRLHRFSTNGKRHDDAGWYVLHLDEIPAGAFGDWRSGISETWCGRRADSLTPEERETWRVRIQKARQEAAAKREREHAKAASRAQRLWDAASPAGADHTYLARKRVAPTVPLRELSADAVKALIGYAPEAKGGTLAGRILIAPIVIRDKLASVEMIDEAGRKHFLAGGAVEGGYWVTAKLPEGDGDGSTVLLAEGVATGISASEATGRIAAAALSAGNMPPVARAIRKRFPRARLILLADLDRGGVGLGKAIEAARAAGGVVAVPEFGPERPDDTTDFNDMVVLCGAEAVRAVIESAVASAKEPDPAAESRQEQPQPDDAAEPEGEPPSPDGASPEVEEDRAPAFSEEALALDFAARHAAELRYVAFWSLWLLWHGYRWRDEETLRAFDLARAICRQAAVGCGKPKSRSILASARTVAAVERLSRADRRLAATVDQWDKDAWLLNMEVEHGNG